MRAGLRPQIQSNRFQIHQWITTKVADQFELVGNPDFHNQYISLEYIFHTLVW